MKLHETIEAKHHLQKKCFIIGNYRLNIAISNITYKAIIGHFEVDIWISSKLCFKVDAHNIIL